MVICWLTGSGGSTSLLFGLFTGGAPRCSGGLLLLQLLLRLVVFLPRRQQRGARGVQRAAAITNGAVGPLVD